MPHEQRKKKNKIKSKNSSSNSNNINEDEDDENELLLAGTIKNERDNLTPEQRIIYDKTRRSFE